MAYLKNKDDSAVLVVTGNRHKFSEISSVMRERGIMCRHYRAEKEERSDWSAEKTARVNALRFSEITGMPVLVDDSGLEFSAYPGFPGSNPKWVFDRIGYDGIMRLLREKDRSAVFKCCAAFCMPGKKPVVRKGFLKGQISEKVRFADREVMPYERIFVPDGMDNVLASLSREEKNRISHRASAFRKISREVAKSLRVTA